jgi:hypothetical protein
MGDWEVARFGIGWTNVFLLQKILDVCPLETFRQLIFRWGLGRPKNLQLSSEK